MVWLKSRLLIYSSPPSRYALVNQTAHSAMITDSVRTPQYFAMALKSRFTIRNVIVVTRGTSIPTGPFEKIAMKT